MLIEASGENKMMSLELCSVFRQSGPKQIYISIPSTEQMGCVLKTGSQAWYTFMP